MDIKSLKFESSPEFKHLENSPIAFFCAEYALDEDPSMYAGGLGVLAGDFILESASQRLPFVAIGLFYKGSKNLKRIKEFTILEKDGEPVIIEVPCGEEIVKARVWTRRFGKSVYLLLLDSNIPGNSPENQTVTGHLYDSNFQIRMKQEAILGIGGVRILSALGFKPRIYHLNEGHTAFAALELLMQHLIMTEGKSVKTSLLSVKKNIVATKHTIFSLAGSIISKKEFELFMGPYCQKNNVSVEEMFKIGKSKNKDNVFSATQFLLNCAGKQNGVSILHTVFEKIAHPDSNLFPITNGVFLRRWQAKQYLKDSKIADQLDETIWTIKQNLRKELIKFASFKSGISLDPYACTVVWSRRFARYKRPELLFSNLERLKKICSLNSKVQFIISGQAHESDEKGQQTIQKIKSIIKDPVFKKRIVYIPDYSISIAQILEKGADVWLNTPERGFEACGTSGMKAGLNGALQMSTSDGWIDEVNWYDIGFILPGDDTANAIYDIIENDIIPLFYTREFNGMPLNWIKRMRNTQAIVESNYTTKRMLYDYLTKAYLVI